MKVTVCIPCHNAARWIGQAVESALAQQGVEPEVIVVDDGSTDGSPDIVRGFGDRVKLLAGPRGGATRARNLAWRAGSGEWVQFLDADDYLEPSKIAAQLAAGGAAEADVIYSPVWIETTAADGSSTREKSETSPDADIFTQWLRWHIPQTGGALWRRAALEALGGWRDEQPCCQEHELYLRALLAGRRFVFSPEPGAVYRIWSEETLCRKDPRLVIRERTKLLDALLDWLRKSGRFTAEHEQAAGRVFFEQSRTWARYDLAGAVEYHTARRKSGPLTPAGPAAPSAYRLFYRVLGFQMAERIAAWMRR